MLRSEQRPHAGAAGAELVPAGRSAGPRGNMGHRLLWERSSRSSPVTLDTGPGSLQSSGPSFEIADGDAPKWSLPSAAGRELGWWEPQSGPSSVSTRAASELTRTGLCVRRGNLRDQAPTVCLPGQRLGSPMGIPFLRQEKVRCHDTLFTQVNCCDS